MTTKQALRNEDMAAVFAELRADLQQTLLSQTERLERLAGLVDNHVLTCELIKMPAEGFVTRQWHLPCASVAVTIHTASATLTIVSGSATSEQAPTNGVGMGMATSSATVANSPVVLNIKSHAVTIYGTVGALFTLQASTRPASIR